MAILFAYAIGALLGYVSGAFPTGYFAGRLWNVDVRKHGSGRTGGTNVLRTAGWGAFAITVIGDILKGVIPVLLVRWIFPDYHGAHALAVLGVLIGHNWSVWIALLARPDPRRGLLPASSRVDSKDRAKGPRRSGRGSDGGGVSLPPATLVIAPVSLFLLIVVRYASVASLSAAIMFPFVMFYFVMTGSARWSYFLLAVVVAVIVIAVHAPNIQRLRTGTERRFGQRLGRTNDG